MDRFTSLLAVFVFAFLAGNNGCHAVCPSGWASIDRSCFKFEQSETMTWNDTYFYCEQLLSYPAMLQTPQTLEGVVGYISQYSLKGNFWLGGSDIVTEGDWLWNDETRVSRGTPFWSLASTVFGDYDEEPQGGDKQNCLALTSERYYYMDDRDCFDEFYPICMVAN